MQPLPQSTEGSQPIIIEVLFPSDFVLSKEGSLGERSFSTEEQINYHYNVRFEFKHHSTIMPFNIDIVKK